MKCAYRCNSLREGTQSAWKSWEDKTLKRKIFRKTFFVSYQFASISSERASFQIKNFSFYFYSSLVRRKTKQFNFFIFAWLETGWCSRKNPHFYLRHFNMIMRRRKKTAPGLKIDEFTESVRVCWLASRSARGWREWTYEHQLRRDKKKRATMEEFRSLKDLWKSIKRHESSKRKNLRRSKQPRTGFGFGSSPDRTWKRHHCLCTQPSRLINIFTLSRLLLLLLLARFSCSRRSTTTTFSIYMHSSSFFSEHNFPPRSLLISAAIFTFQLSTRAPCTVDNTAERFTHVV